MTVWNKFITSNVFTVMLAGFLVYAGFVANVTNSSGMMLTIPFVFDAVIGLKDLFNQSFFGEYRGYQAYKQF
jgi:hypothetical protein